MPLPILQTKLYIPQPSPDHLSRPWLFERLNQGLKGKLTLISAPAGFGKSTLLAQWIHSSSIPFGWISLDDADNDLGRFLAYLIAGLQTIDIRIDHHLLTLLQSPQDYTVESILIPLINGIASADRCIGFVLDDYHLINNQDIHLALTYILEHLPPNLHFVIATRADPPLPLSRLRARGQLREIRADHLRFSLEQADDLLNRIRGFKLSQADLKRLVKRTDGWVAGLQMVSIALEGKEDPADYILGFSGSQDYIADYLTDEVYNQQSEPIRNFLLKTSILDRFSAPLCDVLTCRNDSQRLLKYLKERNLFLVALDEDGHWFRYHRLFADLNNQRLLELYPDELSDLYRRVSEWFEENGYLVEAIDYAFRGDHFDKAATLIELQAEPTIVRSEVATFIRWIRKLPDEIFSERGTLNIYYAWALLVSGEEPQVAAGYLDRVIPSNNQVRGQLAAVRTIIAFYLRQIPEAIDLAHTSLEQLHEDGFFRQIAAWNLSALLFISGDRDRGMKMLEEVTRISVARKNLLVAVIALCRQGAYQVQIGDLHKASGFFERAIQIASDDPDHPLPVACEAMFGLGKIYWEWNQLERASQYLGEGLELCKRWREVAGIEGYVTFTHLKQSQGDADRADQMIQEANKIAAQNATTALDDAFVASQEAFLRLRQNKIEAAGKWATARKLESYLGERDLTLTPKRGSEIVLLYELLVYARYLIAHDQPGDALHILNLIIPSLEHLDHRQKIIEAYILKAIGLDALGKTGDAVAALKKALDLAETAGFSRIFLDEGPVLENLIKESVRRGEESSFAFTLLHSTSSDRSIKTQKRKALNVVEPLSDREREVLRLLTSELSVPELAEHLHISVSTLRTHIRNIYAKLGVHSRFEAVTVGIESGLI